MDRKGFLVRDNSKGSIVKAHEMFGQREWPVRNSHQAVRD